MRIHLFNPENDLALGLGCRNYTPPPHAAAIHRAGALLPLWWADDDDIVVTPPGLEREAKELCRRFGLKGHAACSITDNDATAIPVPWGWSLDAKRQFQRAGMETNLPTDEEIGHIRLLSHRRSSIRILDTLNRMTGRQFPLPIETTEAGKAVRFEKRNPGSFIKSPWSGSGRGVFCAQSLGAEALSRRTEGIIHRQGSVIVEHGLNKIMDFAALFYSHGDSSVEFKGFSIFRTEARGMYSGNIAAPQQWLRQQLAGLTDIMSLMDIIKCEESILGRLLGGSYRGWLGIDMMIHEADGKPCIMPCIELNLRMTMGVAAMAICKRLDLQTPHFLAWEHRNNTGSGTADHRSTVLLPPTDGFSLKLKEMPTRCL